MSKDKKSAVAGAREFDMNAQLDAAFASFQRHDFLGATQRCVALLQKFPRAAEAHFLLANLALVQGDHNECLCQAAIACRDEPNRANYQRIRGHALRGLSRFAEACDAYRAALKNDPRNARLWFNLGETCEGLGDAAAASDAYSEAIKYDPTDPEPLVRRAHVGSLEPVQRKGDLERALALLAEAHGIDTASRLRLQGFAFQQLERFAEAERAYIDLIALIPGDVVTLNNLGLVKLNQGSFVEAQGYFQRCVDLIPSFADGWSNYGLALQGRRDFIASEKAFLRAISLNEKHEKAWLNLGFVYLELENQAEAARCFRCVLDINPDSSAAMNGLGVVAMNAMQRGDEEQAECLFQQALVGDPNATDVLTNLGILAYRRFEWDLALSYFDRVIRIDRNYPQALSNRAIIKIARQQYASGFADYESRIQASAQQDYASDPRDPTHVLPRPSTWVDSILDWRGVRLLLIMEQGLGDQLFFLRFAPLLVKRGAEVMVRCSERLQPLLARMPWFSSVRAKQDDLLPFDHAVVVGDLPLVTKFWLQDGAEPVPLKLSALPSARAEAHAALQHMPRPWIGVTWRAGLSDAGVRYLDKRLPTADLARAFAGFDGSLILLQRNVKPGEVDMFRAANPHVFDACDAGQDLDSLLGLLACLDGYVGVSNTNVHLLAGLGTKGHIFVPQPPEPRWLESGCASPWFPGYHIYRERAAGGWQQALREFSAVVADGKLV